MACETLTSLLELLPEPELLFDLFLRSIFGLLTRRYDPLILKSGRRLSLASCTAATASSILARLVFNCLLFLMLKSMASFSESCIVVSWASRGLAIHNIAKIKTPPVLINMLCFIHQYCF